MRTTRDDDRVCGTALDVTDAELTAADSYEMLDGYSRVLVTLASGAEAWIDVHDNNPR